MVEMWWTMFGDYSLKSLYRLFAISLSEDIFQAYIYAFISVCVVSVSYPCFVSVFVSVSISVFVSVYPYSCQYSYYIIEFMYYVWLIIRITMLYSDGIERMRRIEYFDM